MEMLLPQEKEDRHHPVQEVKKRKSNSEERRLASKANKPLFIPKLKILKEVGRRERKDI